MFTKSYRPRVEINPFSGGEIMMRTTMLSISAAVALLSLFAGCSTPTGQVARGQGPAPEPAPAASEQVGDEVSYVGDEVSYEGDGECEEGQGIPGRRRHGGRVQDWCVPYHVPHDFVYPNAGPPATVQYPYYTCKGPDCFFHQ